MCELEPPPVGLLGRQRTPAPGLDAAGDIFQRLGREHGAHLGVTGLVPRHARDRPQLLEEAGAVTVDRQGELARKGTRPAVHAVAVPLDLAVPAGDEWESLGVDLDPEPIRFPECPELLARSLLQR